MIKDNIKKLIGSLSRALGNELIEYQHVVEGTKHYLILEMRSQLPPAQRKNITGYVRSYFSSAKIQKRQHKNQIRFCLRS